MGRPSQNNNDTYSSNNSYSSDDSTEFSDSGSECDAVYETDLTEDSEIDDEATTYDGESGDITWLLAGNNEHPPEYYIRLMNEFDEVKDTEENYSEGTTLFLNRIEEQWHQ
jgi:hypothetical protein